MVGGKGIVFEAHCVAYGVEELENDLFPVVDWSVLENALRVDPALQNSDGHGSCRGIPERVVPFYFGKPVAYDENEGVPPLTFLQRAE